MKTNKILKVQKDRFEKGGLFVCYNLKMNKKLFLKKGNTDDFELVYKDLTTQFPSEELHSYEKFSKLLKSEHYKFYLLISEQSIPVGYILFLEHKKNQHIWIDYLAIFKKFHSHGFGSQIFELLKTAMPDLRGCLLEVEKEDLSKENTLKRVKFYKRLGAKKLAIDYYYPNKNGDLAMDLYFIPFNAACEISQTQALERIKFTFDSLHYDLSHIDKVFSKIRPL